MFELMERPVKLETAEEVAEYLSQIEAASSKLAGPKAVKIKNEAAYLKCKSYRTDRNFINILNLDINMEGKFYSDLITAAPQEIITRFSFERPIYQLYYSGLMAQLTAAKFFHEENWTSRKIAFAHHSECLSFSKMIWDNKEQDRLKFIFVVRSTSNKLLSTDLFGIIHIIYEISQEFKRENGTEIKSADIAVIISDYQDI